MYFSVICCACQVNGSMNLNSQGLLVVRQVLDHLPVDVVCGCFLQGTNPAHLGLCHLPESLVVHRALPGLSTEHKIHPGQGVLVHLRTENGHANSVMSQGHFIFTQHGNVSSN